MYCYTTTYSELRQQQWHNRQNIAYDPHYYYSPLIHYQHHPDSNSSSKGSSVVNCTTCTPTSVSVCVRSMCRDRGRRRQQCADAPGCLSTSPLPRYIYLFIPPSTVCMYYNIKLYHKPICLTVFTIYSTHTVAYTYTLCTVLVTSVLQQHEPTPSLPISFYLLPLLQLLLLLLVFFL